MILKRFDKPVVTKFEARGTLDGATIKRALAHAESIAIIPDAVSADLAYDEHGDPCDPNVTIPWIDVTVTFAEVR